MPPSSSLLLAEGLQKSAQHPDKGEAKASCCPSANVCLCMCVSGRLAAGRVCACATNVVGVLGMKEGREQGDEPGAGGAGD